MLGEDSVQRIEAAASRWPEQGIGSPALLCCSLT